MSRSLAFLAIVAIAAAVPLSKITDEERALFEKFKATHKKVYNDQRDEAYRLAVFAANLRKIRLHNDEFDQGIHTYTMEMNKFGDMPFEEFHAKYTGFTGRRNEYLRSRNYANLSHVVTADSVDWTQKGAVTPVKNQGQCGSCWAFSSTGAIEGAWYISKGALLSLSEQQLMDCSKPEGNQSCEGGLMDQAFEYVIQSSGLCTESTYPYRMEDEDTCTSCSGLVKISSFSDVQSSEADLAKAVTQQPVAVAIEADQDAFQFYSGGVLTGDCGTNLDHGVLAVGYGVYTDGTPYWKVKNSWGTDWGMQGYVLIQKGNPQEGGQCGITLASSFPVV